MIGYLQGEVIDAKDGTVLLLVGGVGYEVVCSSSCYARLNREKSGGIYTYTAVREDGVYLYGFDNAHEKNMFLKLVSVSGVGPKMGITVLSGMSLESLAVAIASEDVKTLSKIKGLGKKTAERIILELKEKVSSADLPESELSVSEPRDDFAVDENIVTALVTYGLSRQESVNRIKRAMANGAKTTEEIVLFALRGA